MKYASVRVIAAISLPVLLGACMSSSGVATSSDSKNVIVASVPTSVRPCGALALVLRFGPQVVPMTGEHAVMYKIHNRGHVPCSLAGYPGVALYGATGNQLAFHYTDGHGMYVTKARPKTVVLAPGGSGYVLIAKYRCDLGVLASAATIRLTLAGHAPLVLTGRVTAPRTRGVAQLEYCKGGPKDPGQSVGISPIEAKPIAAGPFAG